MLRIKSPVRLLFAVCGMAAALMVAANVAGNGDPRATDRGPADGATPTVEMIRDPHPGDRDTVPKRPAGVDPDKRWVMFYVAHRTDAVIVSTNIGVDPARREFVLGRGERESRGMWMLPGQTAYVAVERHGMTQDNPGPMACEIYQDGRRVVGIPYDMGVQWGPQVTCSWVVR